MHTGLLIAVALAWSAGVASYSPFTTPPPRGWNSYDGFPVWRGKAINESTLMAQAEVMASLRAHGGFDTVTIDEGWGEDNYKWLLDEYGRPIPNPALFPSAAGADGFRPLVQKLQTMRVKLGLWMIKGIPREAVELNLPIKPYSGKPKYTARDIAITSRACPWHKDVYLINMSHPGGQTYYDSVARLWAFWGIQLAKVDCVFAKDLDLPEVVGLQQAFRQQSLAHLMLSPGTDATTAEAELVASKVTSYRLLDDLWDCWCPHAGYASCMDGIGVVNTTRAFVKFASFIGRSSTFGGSFPDGDMIPFGRMGIPFSHTANFTHGMMRYVYGMWNLVKSPIVLGGDLTSIAHDAFVLSLYNNSQIAAMHASQVIPWVVAFHDMDADGSNGFVVWAMNHTAIVGARYVGAFAFSADYSSNYTQNVTISFSDLKLQTDVLRYFDRFDMFTQRSVGLVNATVKAQSFTVAVPANDAALMLLLPTHG